MACEKRRFELDSDVYILVVMKIVYMIQQAKMAKQTKQKSIAVCNGESCVDNKHARD